MVGYCLVRKKMIGMTERMKKSKIFTGISAIIITAVIAAWFSGCGAGREGGEGLEEYKQEQMAGQEDLADIETDASKEDNPDYKVKTLDMGSEEKKYITEKLFSAMEICRSIYEGARIEDVHNIVLEEEHVHKMTAQIAAEDLTVICGSRDENMQNYERVDACLKKAKKKEVAETDFYSVNINGIFRYYKLMFEEGTLFVTFAGATFDKSGKPVLQQIEKIQAYAWQYTEKGWLIWEKALSRNPEMDMHIFYRILPLDEKCREVAEKCIRPVNYFGNNLFLTDWDEGSLENIEFNDLFDFLYSMETGTKPEKERYENGIPAEEFENITGRYFHTTAEQLRQYGAYNEETGTYPWLAVNGWNRVPQMQPFPEVVSCTENEDGTLSARVEAVYVEEGRDCLFAHVVTLRMEEGGGFKYLGNKIDWENAYRVPAYKARRDF